MDKQFTASEVVTKLRERFASGNDVPVPDVRLTRAEFDVIADLLEAREKAVPVAYAEFADNGCVRMWSRGYEERLPGTRMVPLYTHPAPADAERLAEALRGLLANAVMLSRKYLASFHDWPLGKEIQGWPKSRWMAAADAADNAREALAAHDAKAQPPAASVPTLRYFISGPTACAYVDGSEHVEAVIKALCECTGDDSEDYTATDLLAAQENPNG